MAQRSPLLPIFLIVLVDVLGFTIVIPLLAFYSEHFGASALVATSIVSVYAVCSLISTPILGRLSDRFGRRPLLLVSQAGTFLGFIVLGWASALWMVFVGRILDGITAGNLSLAQAYISDHSAPKDRAKAYGVIGVAFGIGFTFGPALGGVLGKYDLHFNLIPIPPGATGAAAHAVSSPLPFIFAAGLSALSMICTFFLLPKELPPQTAAPVEGASATAAPAVDAGPTPPAGRRPGAFDLAAYTEYFKRPGLASLYTQFFAFAFAFSCFTSGFALFAERRFTRDGHAWTASEVGWLFAYTGICGIILQGGLIGRLVKKFGEAKLVIAGFVAAAVAYVLLGLANSLVILVGAATISAFGNGVLRPVITSRISQAVGRHEQGAALGVSGSLQSLALALAPLAGGALIDHHELVAWAMVSATVAAIGLVVALGRREKPKPDATVAPTPAAT